MSLLTLLAFSTDAFAFAPTEEVYVGIEPSRMVKAHPARQHAMKQNLAWKRFVQGEGADWMVVFDEKAESVHKAWGPGIPLDGVNSELQVEQSLLALFDRNPALVSVSTGQLQLRSIGYVERSDTWYVSFDRMVETADGQSVPIWRGGVEARVVQGKLVMVGTKTHPNAQIGSVVLSAESATEEAIALGPMPHADHSLEPARLVVLPVEDGSGLAYRLCWETHTRTVEGPGMWTSLVDAETGELVTVWNEVRFLEGTLNIEHDDRNPNGGLTTSGAPLARVVGAESVYTDVLGAYSVEPDEQGLLSADLNGSYIRVVNDDGDEAFASWEGADFTWTTDQADIAELDTFVFLHHVKWWGEEYAPEVDMNSDKLRSTVNINSSCNAYYDGSVNFYKAGDGCNNTARLADVNYHEWGHGFHYYSLLAGSFDGAISEGIGDVTAVLQTGDPIIAPYFMQNGSGIRRVDTDRVYPDDVVGQVHTDGLIFGGAVWDLWNIMQEEYGPEYGYDKTSELFALGIKGGPNIAESYDEFAVADDDDGDLGNGTPHDCEILEAFQRHGLGPGGSAGTLLYVGHQGLDNFGATVESYELSAEVGNLAPSCIDFSIAEAKVHWSVDGGESWEIAALNVDGDSVYGSIPAQEPGSVVHYFVSIEDTAGSNVYNPDGGQINPHTFLVGDVTEVYFEDFEGGEGDYTHELVAGSDDLGADDWLLGTPIGLATDPDFAFSGNNVWGNDLGGDNWNGEYQNDKHNRLNSVAIDVPEGARLFVQFRRWLGVEDGYYDEARVLVDGEEVWTNHATNRDIGTEHHIDTQWTLHTIEVEDFDGDGQIVISWDLLSDQGLAFGGWNIDDVAVYSYGDPNDNTDVGGPSADTGGVTLGVAPACGCTSTTNTGGAAAGLVLLGLAALRRRS